MGKLIIHEERITDASFIKSLCPFSSIEEDANGKLFIGAGCRLCRACIKKSGGAIEFCEDMPQDAIDKSLWKGICVYADHTEQEIHPVTFELIGKARELADRISQPVYVFIAGDGVSACAYELLHYPVDEVFVCDSPKLKYFRAEPYTYAITEFVNKYKPCCFLVGATPVGRQLAPRVAARLKTGLTADCTLLEIEDNTDLSQIRPAFGGNIMAHIVTPNVRPQMATVRYKIMTAPCRSTNESGKITVLDIDNTKLASGVEILSSERKPPVKSIEQAEVIVAVGRGVKNEAELEMARKLCALLGGELAGTRPMIEAGIIEARRQIGLSGRTVRPKLIITVGVSGAIQFRAGMSASETIVAINRDSDAPIFTVADICVVGDLCEILPRLIAKIEQRKEVRI